MTPMDRRIVLGARLVKRVICAIRAICGQNPDDRESLSFGGHFFRFTAMSGISVGSL